MKINRDSGGDRQVYHRGDQPSADRNSRPADRKAAPARRQPDEPAGSAGQIPAPPRRKAYDVTQDTAYEEELDLAPKAEEPPPRRRRRFPVGLVVVLVVALLVALGGWQLMQLYGEVDGVGAGGNMQTITVAQGSSVADIAAQLEEAGIVKHGWLFRFYTRYSGRAEGLQYGDFELYPGMAYNDIITALSEQKVRRETVRVTIPEGTTAVGIAQLFVDQGLVDSVETFLNCANGTDGSDFSQYAFWNEIPDNEGRLLKCEGYLFPDTYEFFTDASVYDIVDTLYAQFDAKTQDLMATISEKGTTLDQVVILASFIQEEAGVPEEDYKVSACFHNRLESDDPLWAEHKLESNACSYITQDVENNYLWNSPMAEYMGWPAAGAIPEEVLNAYDTYRISGLPAGAISSPGYAAIDAALNPDEEFMAEGYYFFVTGNPNGDHPGEYFYAKTADEHAVNVAEAGW